MPDCTTIVNFVIRTIGTDSNVVCSRAGVVDDVGGGHLDACVARCRNDLAPTTQNPAWRAKIHGSNNTRG